MLRALQGAAVLVFVTALTEARGARAQTADQLFTATRNQLDVTKVVLAQEADWNRGELDTYLGHFKSAPDTQTMMNGPVRGIENVRSAYHINFPNREAMGHLEQTEVEVRELGERFALATGKYHLTRTKKGGGNVDGVFTEIFEKTEKGWMIVFAEES